MKYLNNFKENKEDYYIELESTSLNCNYINMMNNSTQYLKKLFHKDKWHIKMDGKKIRYLDGYTMGQSWVYSITIYELVDEYFLVHYVTKHKNNYYYKCDQLDGVKEMLNDLYIIDSD